jgi:hypothetical protein
MMAMSNAGGDNEQVQIQLTGLTIVPEPSSVCLLLMALFGLVVASRIPALYPPPAEPPAQAIDLS